MSVEIVLPSFSAGMEDAILAQWLKVEGDLVVKGDVLAEVETDKATMELEATADGIIGKLMVANGAKAEVGQVIALLLSNGERAIDIETMGHTSATQEPKPSAEEETMKAAPIVTNCGLRRRVSPLARRLAAQKGVDLSTLTGSGPRGRIVRIDIENSPNCDLKTVPTTVRDSVSPASGIPAGIGEYDAIPVSKMRQVIARRLLESKTTIPHFYLEIDCNLEDVLNLRAQINKDRMKTKKISVNDFVIKAVAQAMRDVPAANVIWADEVILRLRSVDISVAVATDVGLLTPVVRNAERKSIEMISLEVKDLARRAREGRLKPEEYTGGGFTISNLGMFGVKSFSAILNPPQSCILAVSAIEERPIGRNGQVVLAPMMSCTLSVDHRSVDGAVGAEWLMAFKTAIEAPIMLLI